MFGFIPITTTYIFGTLLTANGSIRELNIMAAVGMVLNITLNLIVIPRYEALGAAFVSLSTQTVTAIAQVFIAVRIFNLKVRWDIIIRVMAYIAFLIIAGVLSRMIDVPLVGYVTMLVLSVTGAFIVKLVDLRKLYELILSREE
jgi:O-antigen/teichoic acid export membrane protein